MRAPSSGQLDEHLGLDFVASARQRHAPQQVGVDQPEARLRVGDPLADEAGRDHPAADRVRVVAGPGRRLAIERPLAEDEVAVAAPRRLDQPRRIVRRVLHVAVEQQDVAEGSRRDRRQAACGSPLPCRDSTACRTTSAPAACATVAGAVGRPVVDDEHVIDVRPDATDDVRDAGRFVVGGNQGASRHG